MFLFCYGDIAIFVWNRRRPRGRGDIVLGEWTSRFRGVVAVKFAANGLVPG